MDEIKKGTIITGSNWPEPVEINLIEKMGDYTHIVGFTLTLHDHIDTLILNSEFQNFKNTGLQVFPTD